MNGHFGLVALGVFAYVVFLVASIPAALAVRLIAPEGLDLYGVAGSVWRGRASAATLTLESPAAGRTTLEFGKTRWSSRPLALVLGRVAYHVNAERRDGFVDGVFARTLGGSLHIKQLKGLTSLDTLAGFIPAMPANMFEAEVGVQLDGLLLVDGWPREAEGSVRINNLMLAQPPEALGNYEVQFSGGGSDSALLGDFHDLSGPLEIQGTLTLNPDRTYLIDCAFNPRGGAPATVTTTVGFLCTRG